MHYQKQATKVTDSSHKRGFVLLFLLLLSILGLFSQVSAQDARKELARERIVALKDGCLIYVIQSQRKKLDVIEQELDREGLSPKKQRYYKTELKRTLKNKKKYDSAARKAFEKGYSYSDYGFVYDHDLKQFSKNPSAAIFFFGESLTKKALDPSKAVFFLQEEILGTENNSGMTVLSVKTVDMNNVSRPFPNNYQKYIALKELKIPVIVRAMDYAFFSFYEKATAEEYLR